LERRVIHGQPDVPLPEPSSASSKDGGKKIRDVPLPTPVRAVTPPEPAKDENNIGNKLLKKMGWSAGTGLGLSGEGRVDPMCVDSAFYSVMLTRRWVVKQPCMLLVLVWVLVKEKTLPRSREWIMQVWQKNR